jgi:hypothetical protein
MESGTDGDIADARKIVEGELEVELGARGKCGNVGVTSGRISKSELVRTSRNCQVVNGVYHSSKEIEKQGKDSDFRIRELYELLPY